MTPVLNIAEPNLSRKLPRQVSCKPHSFVRVLNWLQLARRLKNAKTPNFPSICGSHDDEMMKTGGWFANIAKKDPV